MNPRKAETALRVLQKRAGLPTDVELRNGDRIRVVQISWVRDRGEEYDSVTTFLDEESPGIAFGTNEIVRLLEPRDDSVLWCR